MTNIEISEPAIGVALDHAATAGIPLREWITEAIAEKAATQDFKADQGEFAFDDGGFPSPVARLVHVR